MIVTTPGAATAARIDGPPAGATVTARLRDGAGVLATMVTVTPERDAAGVALAAYTAAFVAPAALPVSLEWLQAGIPVGSELVTDQAASAPPGYSSSLLEDAPAGLTLTARLVDGAGTVLPFLSVVTAVLDANGLPLAAYTATYPIPRALPVTLQWLQAGIVVGSETITGATTGVAAWDPPSITELAALMFARVTGEFDVLQNFTDQTRPTAGQALVKIGQAFSIVAVRVGFTLDARFHDTARFLTVLYAALLLEPGYWPETSGPDKSAWEQWKLLYDEGMGSVKDKTGLLWAIAEAGAGDDIGPDDDHLKAIYSFPAVPRTDLPAYDYRGRARYDY